jgi:hypothetical protein
MKFLRLAWLESGHEGDLQILKVRRRIARGFYFARLVFRDSPEQICNRAGRLRQVTELVIWPRKKMVTRGYQRLPGVTKG